MKRTLQNFALLFLSFFLCIVALETTFRILGYSGAMYRYDPDTGLPTLIPNQTFAYKKDCVLNSVTTNSLGFHDREFVKEKAPNIFRIAVMGDSFVQAVHVPIDKTFTARLEARLNSNSTSQRRFEVYAFGRSGNGTAMNILYLSHYALAFQPDLVIDAFYLNDFRDDHSGLTTRYGKETGQNESVSGKIFLPLDRPFALPDLDVALEAAKEGRKPPTLWSDIFRHSAAFSWFKAKWQMARGNWIRRSALPIGEKNRLPLSVENELFLKDPPPAWEEAFALEEKLLGLMKQVAEESGARFAVISLADYGRTQNPEVFLPFRDRLDLDKPERILSAMANHLRIPYLSLLPFFSERIAKTKAPTTFPCDGHWNETGHAWAAEAIDGFLKTHAELLHPPLKKGDRGGFLK